MLYGTLHELLALCVCVSSAILYSVPLQAESYILAVDQAVSDRPDAEKGQGEPVVATHTPYAFLTSTHYTCVQ